MQLSPVPLIRPQVSPARPGVPRPAQPPERPGVGPMPGPFPGPVGPAPISPTGPVPQAPQTGRKSRGGESRPGTVWIANRTPLHRVVTATLQMSNPSYPALLVQLPGERAPVRVPVSAATAAMCMGPLVTLHPSGCSSTRRSWYFTVGASDVAAWPQPQANQVHEAPAATLPLANIAAVLRTGAPQGAVAVPFVVLHAGEGAREAIYLARRFDAAQNDAGFSIHLADLPPRMQVAGPMAAHLTTAHLNADLGVTELLQGDATILCQGAVSHTDLAAFYTGNMEGPFVELPYAASMALVRLLGSKLSQSHTVADWHAALVHLVRQAAKQSEVACA